MLKCVVAAWCNRMVGGKEWEEMEGRGGEQLDVSRVRRNRRILEKLP